MFSVIAKVPSLGVLWSSERPGSVGSLPTLLVEDDSQAFDDKLGPVEFMWEERKKVQIVAFAIKSLRVWISIDKKVVRSEILRIIDACLPIVKRYS